LGLSNFIPRELAKDLVQTNRYLIHASALVVVGGLGSAAVLVGLAPHLGYSSETVASLYLIAPALFPTTLRVVMGAIFIAHQRVEFEAFATLFWTILRILISLYLLSLGYGVISLIAVFTVTSYLAWLNSIFFYVRFIDKPRWEFDWTFLRSMILDLRIFIVLALAGSVFVQAETVILSLVQGEIQVGFYAAAYKLVMVWYLIPQSFMGVVFPVLTRAYQESSHRAELIQDKSIKYLLCLAMPLSIGGFVVADATINLFYGTGFEESILVFRVMAWHVALAFVNNVLWRILLASDQQHLALRVQVASGIIRVVLSLAFTSWWGALGAALALMGGYSVYTLMHVYYIQQQGVQIPFVRLGGRFTLAAVMMGVILFFLTPHMHLFVLVFLGMIIYGIGVILLGAFSKEDVALLRQIWGPGLKEPADPTNHV